MAKIAIKNENIASFGEIYHIMDVFQYTDTLCGPAVAIGGGIEGFFSPHIGVKISIWSEP